MSYSPNLYFFFQSIDVEYQGVMQSFAFVWCYWLVCWGGENVLTTCWIHATAYRTGFRSLNHFRRPIFSSRISITSSGKPETKHMALFIKTKVCLHRYSLTCSFFSAPQLAPVVLKVRRPVERKNDLVLWKKFGDVYHGACYWAGKFTTINAKWPNN